MRIPGYEVIQELARSDWYSLNRAQRKDDRASVLLKIPIRNTPTAVELDLLKREFEILQEISVSGVPRAIEFQRDCGFMVIEDFGGIPLRSLLVRQRFSLENFFHVGIQLCMILAELHRRNIIHKGINSQSIFVHAETYEVQIVDFGLASHTSVETNQLVSPHLFNDALPYISPEQTGRMNRSIDYRTDFYSLGVTFYEILTGVCPFRFDDWLELIHWHIARTPTLPSEINTEVPETVSQIVIKLLSKTAEQRYQSALGLKEDLGRCAQEWAAHRKIDSFPLGQRDVSDQFLVSQKLYGRDHEVEEMLVAFERVCEGPTAMMLVAGYSGIGKTSLIHELYKPIVRERGYFISGKFDQIGRIPYGAFIQAFRALCRQLLAEGEQQLTLWRARLSEALGVNGGVIAQVIPEIELIIGPQPPAPPLAPTEAQNRFRLVFQNFVSAIACKEHPLVIFLDDLQWADSATLGLLHPLLTSRDIQYLFLIGAYRDNEVDATHSLSRVFANLEADGVYLHSVTLGPLAPDQLALLIRDTLHRELADVESLAHLVLQKTEGNPFFVIQFLKALYQAGLIEFDYDHSRWVFHLDAIADAGITDNVVDLMTGRIQRLSAKAQAALMLAACIGNQFDLKTLATISQQTTDDAAANLDEALREGLILPVGRSYGAPDNDESDSQAQSNLVFAFLHDRVQHAAYTLIPDERKQLVHLTVGRLLLDKLEGELADEKGFDVVNHLNLGSNLIVNEQERLTLADLNLDAGRRAKSSTAYEAALGYFSAGIELLAEEWWEPHYDLAFALYLEAAECHYFCGNFEEAEQNFDLLLGRASTILDKAKVYRLRSVQYENMSRYGDAVSTARESLALFGVSFPDSSDEKQAALEIEIASIQSLIGDRSIRSLVDLPVMTDLEVRMVLNILTEIWSSTYIIGDAVLARLISATMVLLSLVHGNAEESAYGYVTHAITVGPIRKDYEAAYEFGKLALEVNERFNDLRRRAKIYQQFHAHVNLWRQPMQTCIPYAREACRSGLETGDFLYAAYGASTETWPAMLATQNLKQFVREYSPNLALIHKLKITSFADALRVMLNWARAIEGETRTPLSLSNEEFDEDEYAENYRGNPFFTTFYAVARLQLCYTFGEFEKALEAAHFARENAYNLSGTIWPVTFDFWNGLTLAALYSSAEENQQKSYLEEIKKAQSSFAVLAENCPENFLCQSLLLAAEAERIKGQPLSAMNLYGEAIHYAEQTNMLRHRALANELYARFWMGLEQDKLATVFIFEALHDYEKWGARAKVEELERKYAKVVNRNVSRISQTPTDDTASQSTRAETLDVVTAMRAAQAIARESELERLLARLMRIAIENAGAQRGSFILEHNGEAFIHVEGSLDAVEVKLNEPIPLTEADGLSQRVVNYVRRTKESVVIADASADDRYARDEYIARTRPRSIMCVPMLNQGSLIGAFYLENNLITDAFTADRIKIIWLVSSEAAISLENAKLYDEAQQEVARRREAEEILRSIVEGTASVTGNDFFYSLVHHLGIALKVRYAFVTECRDGMKSKARTLAFWNGEEFGENFEYDVALTPCKDVLDGKPCFYPEGVQKLFPGDTDLVDLGIESYLGVPIFNAAGEVIGHLVVLDNSPMDESSRRVSVLKVFAARAGAEMERLEAEANLKRALAEVETLKNRLQAENIYLQEEIRREHHFEEIVGTSPPLLDLLSQIEVVAPTDSTVLIQGETGTGKELIARAIHNRSRRKDRPLVKVNCGAISAGLVESELFGHVKGAFTGAIDRRAGRFELAHGGTLFLDEVGELPLDTQVKLLRALQEQEFEPVGSSKTVRVDVRIIAATNRNLEEAVKAGRFRQDLFYRLNVFPLSVPSLSERQLDIPQLVMFFMSHFSKKFGKKIESISQESMQLLTSYSWPGNVRELQNIIERAVVLSQGSTLTLARNLFPSLESGNRLTLSKSVGTTQPTTRRQSDHNVADQNPDQPPFTLEQIERRHILDVLEQTRWVIDGPNGAAKLLSLHPNTLRSRMKKLGIQRPRHEMS
jgi:predicted ATPase/tRNA A-37 threonylcarbamoyl transferase component Bud32